MRHLNLRVDDEDYKRFMKLKAELGLKNTETFKRILEAAEEKYIGKQIIIKEVKRGPLSDVEVV